MDRKDFMAQAKRLVVKVGTAVVSSPAGTLDTARVAGLAEQVDALVSDGRQVVLVTSGSIGAGMGELGLERRPTALPQLQAAAAVGQSHLMGAYDRCFKKHGHHAAQILLTRNDFDERARYLNIRNSIAALFELGAISVINENDTVSVDEIRLGDNDLLSSLVASLLGADLLIILSVVDGLLDADHEVIPTVEKVTDKTRALDHGTRSLRGTGGLRSKLDAAEAATRTGTAVVIANGTRPGVLARILAGEPEGTYFVPRHRKTRSRKRWFAARTVRGTLHVDAGARRAVVDRGKSLLPSGIVSVAGTFSSGDTVAIAGPDGRPFATGLCNLSSEDLSQVCGLKSRQVRRKLGAAAYEEAVHRDNMWIRD
jgi:glutamate 5-kinase